MNAIDHALHDEVRRLMDRLAALPEVGLERLTAIDPALRARVDDAEAALGELRLGLLEGYAAWRSTLAELEELWRAAAARSAAPEETAKAEEVAAALAA